MSKSPTLSSRKMTDQRKCANSPKVFPDSADKGYVGSNHKGGLMFDTIREFYDDMGLIVTVLMGHLLLLAIAGTLALDYVLVCGAIELIKGL